MRDVSGKYQLLCKLGHGGMGQVWGGVRRGPNDMVMPCAIKVLHPALAATDRDRQRFFNEARIAAQLDHGRIVKVTDISEIHGAPCLVMEWVDGVNLREFTRKIGVPLELEVCLHIVGEVLAALEYAHERTVAGEDAGVIHYDVTPGNILISSSGEVKLTDFGIARFTAAADVTASRSIGTPRYMSPEQMSGRARRETDIYSLGVVLHELIEGARFLDGCDRQQLQMLVLGGHVPALTRAGVPAWVTQLHRQMLANRPDDRPRAADARSWILQKSAHYHLAGQQLRELYQRLVGERRSGLTDLMNTKELFDAPATTEVVAAPTPEPEVSACLASSKVFGDEDVAVTQVLDTFTPPPRSLRLVAALGGGGLLLFGVTIGLLVDGCRPDGPVQTSSPPASPAREEAERMPAARGGDDVDPARSGRAVTSDASPPATTPRVPETQPTSSMPEPAPSVTAPAPAPAPAQAEPDPVQTESAAARAEPAEPEPEPEPAKTRAARVEVTFMISGVSSAEIKVGSRVVAYSHVAMTKLPPGKYVVRWHESPDQPWHRAGTLVVEPLAKGSYYEVRLGLSDILTKTRTGGSAQ
ncbi:serine/threonine protein kinase [Enhygromyxa salina]|uniref:Serine/threonine-protein kinase pkn6 n=1 Tax=Enhygromyxa salina TaxID=215803 RepID=A0A2S9YVN4_9BACT|nr:serine/threonine-protein kinase [Enhygromyxa salina]PRQ09171.1 Serine/threonine-protein kinase pkn6 [Enhygromyxa salina]